MKHTKQVEVPAKTETQVSYVTCDLCGSKITHISYTVDEVTIKYRTGDSYPDGGSGEETSVDMCGLCFETKLVPWLRSQGAEPMTNKWDW